MFFCFSDHFWHRQLLPQTAFFDQTVLCRNLCEPSLTPKNIGQWGCCSEQFVAHVLFFWPWTSLRGTSLAQDHPVRDPPLCCVVCRLLRCVAVLCCVVVCVVVWSVGAVCVQDFCGCVQDLGAPPRLPPPPDPLLVSRTSPPPDRPTFRFFFPSPATIFILSSSLWGSSRGILVVLLKRHDTQMCTFGLSGCRVKPRRLLQNVKNNFTMILPPSPKDFRNSQ